mmetsp:Transcript_29296/g.83283  ORF Transcript_29296/g.83283 Transcript_29296/m.83283 type:complete len:286 (-) Transcript_29296:361-1218(-)
MPGQHTMSHRWFPHVFFVLHTCAHSTSVFSPQVTSRCIFPQRQSTVTLRPHVPQGPSWQVREHPCPQRSCRPSQREPQSGNGSVHFCRRPTQRTSSAAAASWLHRLVPPQAHRSPQVSGSRGHGGQSPAWQRCSHSCSPQSSGMPHGLAQLKSSWPQSRSSSVPPQKQGCNDFAEHGGQGPAWHRTAQKCSPQGSRFPQASPQDHLGGSPHFVVVDSSRPQWHRPGGPTAWHFGQGPGWQSSGQRCLQPRSRSQTSPQLCANQCGLGSGSKIFVQKHVYCGIGPT